MQVVEKQIDSFLSFSFGENERINNKFPKFPVDSIASLARVSFLRVFKVHKISDGIFQYNFQKFVCFFTYQQGKSMEAAVAQCICLGLPICSHGFDTHTRNHGDK